MVVILHILRQKNFFGNQRLKNPGSLFIPIFFFCGTDFEPIKGNKSQIIMKKLFFILLVATGSLISKPATAQISVNINIGSQPVWGPVGYDYVEYYYLPDIEVYYYVPRHQFVYLSNGRWIFATSLPYRYRSYNLYSGYKVVINDPRPYLSFTTHRVTYAKYKGNNGRQVIIRNSNDPKYYVVKGHPKYNGGKKKVVTRSSGNSSRGNSPGGSNGRGKGGGKGKG